MLCTTWFNRSWRCVHTKEVSMIELRTSLIRVSVWSCGKFFRLSEYHEWLVCSYVCTYNPQNKSFWVGVAIRSSWNGPYYIAWCLASVGPGPYHLVDALCVCHCLNCYFWGMIKCFLEIKLRSYNTVHW